MELEEALNRRRSVRSYTGEPLTAGQLEHVLTAAYEAPVGGGHYESIHLTLVSDPELLRRIDEAAAAFFGKPGIHPLYGAPLLVVVSSNKDGNVASANVGDVIENMTLAATGEGVGSCFIYGATAALAQDEGLLAALQLPEGFVPLGSVILGQTDEPLGERTVPASHHFSQNVVA